MLPAFYLGEWDTRPRERLPVPRGVDGRRTSRRWPRWRGAGLGRCDPRVPRRRSRRGGVVRVRRAGGPRHLGAGATGSRSGGPTWTSTTGAARRRRSDSRDGDRELLVADRLPRRPRRGVCPRRAPGDRRRRSTWPGGSSARTATRRALLQRAEGIHRDDARHCSAPRSSCSRRSSAPTRPPAAAGCRRRGARAGAERAFERLGARRAGGLSALGAPADSRSVAGRAPAAAARRTRGAPAPAGGTPMSSCPGSAGRSPATTVAERGPSSIRAISPKWSPGPSVRIASPSMLTWALPSSIRKKPTPVCPSVGDRVALGEGALAHLLRRAASGPSCRARRRGDAG